MLFSGENVSSVPGNLKRLAAARGKLAVNGGEVISGDVEWQDQSGVSLRLSAYLCGLCVENSPF